MKIGIFGGSFNPIHKKHESIALELIKQQYVDKVVFVPTGCKYTYKNNLKSSEDRLNMIKIIVDKHKNLKVSDYELKDQVVYTYQTLDYFREKYKNDEIYFICGVDNLSYIDKWERGEYILSNYKILVIKRDSNDIDRLIKKYKKYKSNIIVTHLLMEKVSSTEIREEIKMGKKCQYLDEDVYKYIKNKGLYNDLGV